MEKRSCWTYVRLWAIWCYMMYVYTKITELYQTMLACTGHGLFGKCSICWPWQLELSGLMSFLLVRGRRYMGRRPSTHLTQLHCEDRSCCQTLKHCPGQLVHIQLRTTSHIILARTYLFIHTRIACTNIHTCSCTHEARNLYNGRGPSLPILSDSTFSIF